jgi:hypothetical protein
MGHPLEGCNAKLERARHHFESLREAIQQDFDQGPDLIPSELDPVAGRYVFRVLQDVSLPSELEWSEPPQVSWRRRSLRGWGHEQARTVSAGVA